MSKNQVLRDLFRDETRATIRSRRVSDFDARFQEYALLFDDAIAYQLALQDEDLEEEAREERLRALREMRRCPFLVTRWIPLSGLQRGFAPMPTIGRMSGAARNSTKT